LHKARDRHRRRGPRRAAALAQTYGEIAEAVTAGGWEAEATAARGWQGRGFDAS
jgi:hypothetical protein